MTLVFHFIQIKLSQMSSQDGPATRTRGQENRSQPNENLFTSRFSDAGCPLILENVEGITLEDCPKALRLNFHTVDDGLCCLCNQETRENDSEIMSLDLESRLWLNSFVYKVGDGFSIFWDRSSQGLQAF